MPKFLKKSMKLNWNFQRGMEGGGGGGLTKSFHLEIWRFSGKTLCVL